MSLGQYVTLLTGGTETKKGCFGKIQGSISHIIEYNGTFDSWCAKAYISTSLWFSRNIVFAFLGTFHQCP